MASKDQWRYQIHIHPVDVELSSSNKDSHLAQKGSWGTRLQAASEGILVGSSLAASFNGRTFLSTRRGELKSLTREMAEYTAEGFAFSTMVDGVPSWVHVSLEIN